MMFTGGATEQPMPSFLGSLDVLDLSKPSNPSKAEALHDMGSGDCSGAIKVLRDLDEMIRQEFG